MNKLGETNVNSKGERFAISEYTDCNNITVIFEDDSVKHTTYTLFKKGCVSKRSAQDKSSWIGEIVKDRDGTECHITEFNSEKSVTVQYPNGDIVSELSFDAVMSGAFTRRGEEDQFVKSGEGIDAERTATKENAIYMLNRYRRCVMIRPCAFGKTRIGLELFSLPRYQRCLFLHPESDDLNAEVVRERKSVKKIDTKTYAWLRNLPDEAIKSLDYDIVLCDEVHCIGGDYDKNGRPLGAYVTYSKIKLFMESHPKTHFVGATATPLRMDGINVIEKMFHNHTCYPYTEEDAIEDGYLKKPDYYYNIYDLEKGLMSELKSRIHVEMNRDEMRKTLNLTNEEIEEVDERYMDKHIKKTCDELLPGQNRLSFIVFYPTNLEIEKNRDKVIGWFKKAYPKYQIKDIIVTARTKRTLDEVSKMLEEPIPETKPGRVDLIFNCEKLCMSYHSKSITGLIIDRKTQSIAKYMQMIGRILSCDDDSPAIIFDIADNIHSDFICPVPKRVDAEKVIPMFDKAPSTFEEVLAAHPHARRWDVIRRTNEKARKSIEAAADIETPNRSVFATTENWDGFELADDAEQDVVSRWAEEQHRDEEPLEYITGIEAAESTDFAMTQPHSSYEQYEVLDNIPDVEEPEEAGEDEPIGFDNAYYYDYNAKEFYSKNVNILNKKADFESDMLKAIQKHKEKIYEAIIEEWHKYPTCDDVYSAYNEVDKNKPKYKFLKSCSEWLHGIPVDETIKYMIEDRKIS